MVKGLALLNDTGEIVCIEEGKAFTAPLDKVTTENIFLWLNIDDPIETFQEFIKSGYLKMKEGANIDVNTLSFIDAVIDDGELWLG